MVAFSVSDFPRKLLAVLCAALSEHLTVHYILSVSLSASPGD